MRHLFYMIVFSLAACHLPRDQAHTLERARGGYLKVGFSDAKPWIFEKANTHSGIEARIIRDFAESISAQLHWRQGTTHAILEALKTRQLDVAVGGFLEGDPALKGVGITLPYLHVRTVVAIPPGARLRGDERIAAEDGTVVVALLRNLGLNVQATHMLSREHAPLATEDYRARAWGLEVTDISLRTTKHVMAVAPGENALLRALDNFLITKRPAASDWLINETPR